MNFFVRAQMFCLMNEKMFLLNRSENSFMNEKAEFSGLKSLTNNINTLKAFLFTFTVYNFNIFVYFQSALKRTGWNFGTKTSHKVYKDFGIICEISEITESVTLFNISI